MIKARRTLPPDALAYVEGGAEDERTLDENRRAFTRWFLRPRMLTGAPAADPSTTFLGMPLAMPLLVAPFAGDTLLHADGYRAVLEAAASLGTLAVVPEVTGETLEALASAAPGAARVFQLSLRHPHTVLVDLLSRAADAGYGALCVTVDVPVVGVRRRELRHPGARLEIANFPSRATGFVDHTGERERPWTWSRLADVMAGTDLPFAVKGVLTAEDTRALPSRPERPRCTCRTTVDASSTARRRPWISSPRSSTRSAATPRSRSTAASAAAATS